MTDPSPAVTELLGEWSRRSPRLEAELFEAVYQRLLEIARHLLRREPTDHTLDPAGLVNEAFLRLVRQRRTSWRNRGHFFSVSATAMRRVLADHGRRKTAAKRGARPIRVPLDERSLSGAPSGEVDLAVQQMLERMHDEAPRLAAVVELRVFGGLTLDETAAVLHRSRTSVVADWAAARDWLAAQHAD